MKLAVEGGKPVRSAYLSYTQHWVDKDDIAGVLGV